MPRRRASSRSTAFRCASARGNFSCSADAPAAARPRCCAISKRCSRRTASAGGEILFCGTPLAQVSERDQAAKIGFVMQNPDDQIVTDKVWHELAFGLESLGCDQTAMRTRVAEMACYFGIQDWFHRDVATLSGGQKQLLNLASIMAMQPEVLILDEPTSQLDPIAASDFLNTVRKINTELGTTVIITEHRLEDIFPYAAPRRRDGRRADHRGRCARERRAAALRAEESHVRRHAHARARLLRRRLHRRKPVDRPAGTELAERRLPRRAENQGRTRRALRRRSKTRR